MIADAEAAELHQQQHQQPHVQPHQQPHQLPQQQPHQQPHQQQHQQLQHRQETPLRPKPLERIHRCWCLGLSDFRAFGFLGFDSGFAGARGPHTKGLRMLGRRCLDGSSYP